MPGCEAVHPVGQVHAVREARDDEVEEDVPAPPQGQVDVEEREVDVGRQRFVEPPRGDDRDDDGDRAEPEELPAAREAEGPAPRDLRPVVDEPDRRTAERNEERRHGRHRPVREDQERYGHRDHDQEAAHRRRPLLHDVALRSLLPDLLAELVLAQEVDELRAAEDGDHHRQHAREQDFDHSLGLKPRLGPGRRRQPRRSLRDPWPASP